MQLYLNKSKLTDANIIAEQPSIFRPQVSSQKLKQDLLLKIKLNSEECLILNCELISGNISDGIINAVCEKFYSVSNFIYREVLEKNQLLLVIFDQISSGHDLVKPFPLLSSW